MKSLRALWPILIILFLLSGCLAVEQTDETLPVPPQENRLVIYTSHQKTIYEPLIREFEARTGIWIQIETGGTIELLDRIKNEGENTPCDLIFGGGIETLEAHKDLFLPYQSPLLEQVDPIYLTDSVSWTPLSALPLVLVYNPKLVRLNPPSGWEDLLNPTWQGRIAYADPETSASAYTALSSLIQFFPDMDSQQILQQFAANLDGKLLTASDQVIEEVAHGNCYIGLTLEDDARRSIENGYDIAMIYPREGTSMVCDGAAILSSCQHVENAQRFIDFLLSQDVQNYLMDHCYRRSVLTHLQTTPDSQIQWAPYDILWASSCQKEILAQWHSMLQEVTP